MIEFRCADCDRIIGFFRDGADLKQPVICHTCKLNEDMGNKL